MRYYVGLDVTVKLTAMCIVAESGKLEREALVPTEPEELSAFLSGTGLVFGRIGLEAGPLSSWLYDGLKGVGLPAVCVEARHMQAALSAMRTKTDRHDPRGVAQMMCTGGYRAVHVKSRVAQTLRLLLVVRRTLLDKRRDIDNVIRGTLKVFGSRWARSAAGASTPGCASCLCMIICGLTSY